MSKRKFSELQASSGLPDRAVQVQREQLDVAIESGSKSLFRACKVARGFERQKLGRRQKAAREKHEDAETSRLTAEIAALKALNLAAIAELHLLKTLFKSKPIASHPSFPSYVKRKVEKSPQCQDAPTSNVQARLYNANAVKSAVNDAVTAICAILEIDNIAVAKPKRLRAADFKSGDRQHRDGHNKATSSVEKLPNDITNGNPSIGKLQGPTSSDEQHDESDASSFNSDTYASHLASASPPPSSSASSAPISSSHTPVRHSSFKPPSAPSISDGTWSPSPSPEPEPRAFAKAPPSKSTTFLPSLSLGGYWSGSEAGSDDLGEAEIKPRKNRRGQRERRAIWEKKFGANANHIKQGPGPRDEGWDPKRGATVERTRERKKERVAHVPNRRERRAHGASAASGANSEVLRLGSRNMQSRKANMESSLHPSWEAAKKAKERKQTVGFEGKKVVFD